MPNVLTFRVEDGEHGARAVTACIDGIPLTQLIEAFEIANGYDDPAGGYSGLIPDYFRYGPLDRYFLGESGEPPFDQGRIYLLGCECGEVGCWPLQAHVGQYPGEVRWTRFEQGHRPARDYSGFGPFAFDSGAYGAAVRELRDQFEPN